MNKKYVCSKYIDKKILNEVLGMSVNPADIVATTLLGSGTQAAVGMVFNAGKGIKNLYDSTKFALLGCDRITDPTQREECKKQQTRKIAMQRIRSLKAMKANCKKAQDPSACDDDIEAKITQEEQNLQ